mmetsp:Transcript_49752/g.119763  ORF Transcript_49752/g.119763 Transcript_49752/m.119763 type:complete len:218 (-) Transcript_49752:593-1246(-)
MMRTGVLSRNGAYVFDRNVRAISPLLRPQHPMLPVGLSSDTSGSARRMQGKQSARPAAWRRASSTTNAAKMVTVYRKAAKMPTAAQRQNELNAGNTVVDEIVNAAKFVRDVTVMLLPACARADDITSTMSSRDRARVPRRRTILPNARSNSLMTTYRSSLPIPAIRNGSTVVTFVLGDSNAPMPYAVPRDPPTVARPPKDSSTREPTHVQLPSCRIK